jgi:hypothetical protein
MASRPIRIAEGLRFVDAALIAPLKRNTGTARVDEPADAVTTTTVQYVFRSAHVDVEIRAATNADARERRRVEYAVDSSAGGDNRFPIADVASHDLDAEGGQLRIIAAAEATHAVATGHQLFDDVPPQEAAAAGHE